jgi:hypothetical protein
MSRFTLSLAAAALGLVAFAAPTALHAQTAPPKVFYACYVPSSGTVYRIKETDLKQECAKATHVQFSWTDGTSTPGFSKGITVISSQAVVAPTSQTIAYATCPAGSHLVGGGHRITSFSLPLPIVTRSSPDDTDTGWAVNIWNGAAGQVTFTVYVRCAQ